MSDSSVSFHPKVKIVIYDTPVEQWAEEGWMEYFA
jgi:hypothetical protein